MYISIAGYIVYPFIYTSKVEYLMHDRGTDAACAYLEVKCLFRIETLKAVFLNAILW